MNRHMNKNQEIFAHGALINAVGVSAFVPSYEPKNQIGFSLTAVNTRK